MVTPTSVEVELPPILEQISLTIDTIANIISLVEKFYHCVSKNPIFKQSYFYFDRMSSVAQLIEC